ncbi:MAG TPA: hypothetical protein VGY57_08885, partial [Vicinamibacterales bacterium]|nr:hypothetical protein [Vicinamibacterales bacterium]
MRTGTKCVLMNDATCGLLYTSASSRAQPVHIGAALKSSSTDFPVLRARCSPSSKSVDQAITGSVAVGIFDL